MDVIFSLTMIIVADFLKGPTTVVLAGWNLTQISHSEWRSKVRSSIVKKVAVIYNELLSATIGQQPLPNAIPAAGSLERELETIRGLLGL